MRIDEAVKVFLEGYFSTCKRSAKTRSAYGTDLGQFQTRFGGEQILGDVNPESLEQWATVLVAEKYASVSIRRKFATLRVFFGYWMRKGIMDSSPLWKIRLDLARERRLPRAVTSADMKRLLERAWAEIGPTTPVRITAVDPYFLALRNVALLEVLFATGIRVGELVSLSLADWSEDDASFVVKGKGSRQRLAFLPDHRSLTAVKQYLVRRRELKVDHDAVFLNRTGRRLTEQGVSRELADLAVGACITSRLTPHMVRHTVATLLLRQGADIRVVQELLGHSSIATTQRYTEVSKEHLRATLRAHHPSHQMGINVGAQSTLF